MVHTAEHRDSGKVNLEDILRTTCPTSEAEVPQLRHTNVITVAAPISLSEFTPLCRVLTPRLLLVRRDDMTANHIRNELHVTVGWL